MDPTTLVPATGPYQVEWWIFQALLSLGFLVHILLVNVMLGTAAMALAGAWRGGEDPTGKAISTKLPTVIALTVNFGVVPLLFLQVLYGHFFYISDIIMGWYWLAIPFLVMAAYYLAYIFDFKYARLGDARRTVLALAVACMLFVTFSFVNNLTMFITPERWLLWFENDAGTVVNFGDPALIPRWLHFVVASLAVGGLATALYWNRPVRKDAPGAGDRVRRGMLWFFSWTLLQVFVGSWFLSTMRPDVLSLFLGGSALYTGILALGLLGMLGCLVEGWRRRPGKAAQALVFTAAMMVVVRELMRVAYLSDFYQAWDVPVRGEYSPMVLFLASLVAGLFVIAHVLGLAVRAGKEA